MHCGGETEDDDEEEDVNRIDIDRVQEIRTFRNYHYMYIKNLSRLLRSQLSDNKSVLCVQ